jgi:hypothetical protein
LKPTVHKLPICSILAATTGLLLTISPMKGQGPLEPSTSQNFYQIAQGMTGLRYYAFGTGAGSNVTNTTQLANYFTPYGIAGTTVIQQEWERYQQFNGQNFVFTANSLNLTATLAGGLYPGGINSGQVWTKEAFKPGVTGYNVYAIQVRMKIPSGQGMWPAMWLYTKQAGQGDGSEIDTAEFMIMQNQNQYDWGGFNHGPGVGSTIYDARTNPWVWHPGTDFSAGYHDYQLVWTPNATYKYVDGKLIFAQYFNWTAPGPGSLGLNLAVGSSNPYAPGLTPNSTSEFPAALSVQTIGIWGK